MKGLDYISKLRGLYNYNDGLKVKIAYLSSFPVATVVSFLSNNPYTDNGIWLLHLFLMLLDISNSFGKDADFKDIKKIRKIYDEVLKNYTKLNKDFELENPVELYVLFTYMLQNGYLSKEHQFEEKYKDTYDINSIHAANVLNGKVCCRHIAVMFKDILKLYGMDSNILLVTCNGVKAEISILNAKMNCLIEEKDEAEQEGSLEQLSWLNSEIIRIKEQLRSKLIDLEEETKKVRELTEIGKSNHVITMAEFNNNCYLLDPSQFRTYRTEDGKSLFDKIEDNIFINYNMENLYKLFDEDTKIELIKKKILLPGISREKELEYMDNTLDLCDKNQDTLERFYKENHEAYEEISDKLLRLNKK